MKKMTITPDLTFKQVQDWLRANVEEGAVCACCNQTAKIYLRPITGAMSAVLIILYNESKRLEKWNPYIHVEELLKSKHGLPASFRGDFPKLRFWDLIEPEDSGREDGSTRNGYYRITKLGEQFVLGMTSVPAKVRIYNNRKLKANKEFKQVTIHQTIGKKFDYDKFMKGECADFLLMKA